MMMTTTIDGRVVWFVRKPDGPWWMRALCRLWPRFRNFLTTVGFTIYVDQFGEIPPPGPILMHELQHVRQVIAWERWVHFTWLAVFLHSACYLFFPVPVFFAWYRWRCEREGYLMQRLLDPNLDMSWVVQTLWYGYAWPWPRWLMMRWFAEHLK